MKEAPREDAVHHIKAVIGALLVLAFSIPVCVAAFFGWQLFVILVHIAEKAKPW